MRLTIAGCIASVLLTAGTASAQSVEAVERQIAEQMSKYKTFAYKMKTSSEVRAEGMQMQMETEGSFEVARRGDTWVSRMDAETGTTRKLADGKTETEEGKMLQVFDGEYSWTLSETAGRRTAMKAKVDPKQLVSPFNVREMFRMLRQDFDLKLLPDGKVDGKDVWAIQATPKDKEQMRGLGRSVSYYRKDNAILAKGVTYDAAGKPISTTICSDVRTNVDFPPDHFKFKAPAGVEVVDVTEMGAPQRPDTPSTEASKESQNQPAAQPKPAAEPKKDDKKGAKDLLKRFVR